MHVHELMTKDVIAADMDTPVSEILSKMVQNRIHQVPVLASADKKHKAGDLKGIVTLNKIVVREFDAKTKAKAALTSTAKLSPDDTIDRAAELIVGSNQRAIPVWDGELIGILSEEDLMRVIRVDGAACAIAKPCICIEDDSGIGKAKDLMVQKNISRVGVTPVGKPNTLSGIVGTMDLVKAYVPGCQRPHGGGGLAPAGKAGAEVRAQRDRGYMEAKQLDKTTVLNFMHQAPLIDGTEAIAKAIELLQTNEEVAVKLDGGAIGIITPKDVLRAYLSARSVALVQIVGLDREDDVLDVARVQQKAAQIIQHLARFADLQPMKIYVKQHKKHGAKVKYSVKVELPSNVGKFVVTREHGKNDKSYGQLTTIVQHALDNLEREVLKAQEKFRKPDRAWVSEMRSRKEEGIGLRERKIKKSDH